MKLTNKGRYAVMAMADLASNTKDGPISLAEISTRQNISLDYLEQIFLKLKKTIFASTFIFLNKVTLLLGFLIPIFFIFRDFKINKLIIPSKFLYLEVKAPKDFHNFPSSQMFP